MPDDFGDDFADATSLGAESIVRGNLEEAGDSDVFRIELAAGQSYTFQQLGESSGSGSLSDPYLYLYDDAGNEVAFNDDHDSLDSQFTFTPDSDGTYFIRASPYSSDYTGTYLVFFNAGNGPLLLEGTADANELAGTGRSEQIFALEGDDTVNGGGGGDLVHGGAGDDTLSGALGDDFLDGGEGVDTASWINASTAVAASLATGGAVSDSAGNDALGSIESLEGSAFGDTLTGDSGENTLIGRAGDDVVAGGDGVDLLGGSPGDDQLSGGGGNDGLDGGDGADIMSGGDGADTMVADDGADELLGGAGDDRMGGGAGDDALFGEAGTDLIDGSDYGNDRMSGGDDADVIALGIGSDTAAGNAGADTFVLRIGGPAVDRLTDFTPGTDHMRNDTGLDTAAIISAAAVSNGDTVLRIGTDDFVVITGVTGIGNDWFA